MKDFDPYFKWLGIPPEEQPPNHYRLIGIPLFASDPEVIQNALDQRMAYLRTMQIGPRAAQAEKLLNELSAATVCLLDPGPKAAYDLQLRSIAPPAQETDPPQVNAPLAAPVAIPLPRNIASTDPPLVEDFRPVVDPRAFYRAVRNRPINGTLIQVVLGGVAGLIVAAVILRFAFNVDPFRTVPDNSSAARTNPLASRESAAGSKPITPSENIPNPNIQSPPAMAGELQKVSDSQPTTNSESSWSYGYGTIDWTTARVADFQPLPHFREGSWVDGPTYPNGPLNWATIRAGGFHPTADVNLVVIVRWTSPVAGTISIRAKTSLLNPPSQTDGVRVYIVSSRHGVVWNKVVTESGETTVERLTVMRSDTIDFCADCYKTVYCDSSALAATIEGFSPSGEATGNWDSIQDFHGPPGSPVPAKGKVEFKGHKYLVVFRSRVKWTEARELCAEMGGQLAIANSPEEFEFLSTLNGFHNLWIGATNVDGKWKWLDGTTVDRKLWSNGAPKDSAAELYVYLNGVRSIWNHSIEAEGIPGFICEWAE